MEFDIKTLTSSFLLLFLVACAPGTSAPPTPLPGIGQDSGFVLLTGGTRMECSGVTIETGRSSVLVGRATSSNSWGGVINPPQVGELVRALERRGDESLAFAEPGLVISITGDHVRIADEWDSIWVDWTQVMAWGD